ncbi:MAG: hypothetical protein WA789_11290 [Candidatus Acidiferrum sp.]
MKIYVDLPDELVAVWCPVEAVHIGDDVYEITQVNDDPEDTRWAFNTGAKVRCKAKTTKDGEQILVAYEEVSNSRLA